MLKHLHIKDYTLIESLDIDFKPGFSVITGETGAGKSIIVGALNLLLGQRADTKVIKEGCGKCIVEAEFSFENNLTDIETLFSENDIEPEYNNCIIRREISASGKSRAFINDSPVNLTILKELGDKLMDIHSQHQNLFLNNEDFQLQVADTIAHDSDILEEYIELFNHFNEAKNKAEALKKLVSETNSQRDYLEYQYNELKSANLVEGEYEELQEEASAMSHSEDIKSALFQIFNLLNEEPTDLIGNLKNASNTASSISDVLPKANTIAQRLESTYIELKDLGKEISNLLDSIEFDPVRLEEINQRMGLISSLMKKYHAKDVAELISLYEQLKEQLSHLDNSDVELQQAEAEVEKTREILASKAKELTSSRTSAAHKIESEMESLLVPLGMPNIKFEVRLNSKDFCSDGADSIQFFFSANKNATLQPISQIASGGEIARVMLALKAMISGTTKLPTIIFDEIDTGVSGRIAEKMAEMMVGISDEGRQVISITHLPQIAAMGNHHYKVAKMDNDLFSETTMALLSDEERIREIAAMLSGSHITNEAINNAKSLLKL